jgi:hypothetical protein
MEQFYEKLSAEYATFIENLKGLPPDKIIESAYEKVFKEIILMCFESGDDFSEKEIATFFAFDCSLDMLYQNLTDAGLSQISDLLHDRVLCRALWEAKRQNIDTQAQNPPLSDKSVPYTRGDFENRKKLLIKRLNKNLTDYHQSLAYLGRCEILDLDIARKIAAMQDAHKYMTALCDYDDSELDFYLRFQNPLAIIADIWLEQNCNIEDMTLALDYINNHRSRLLARYSLSADAGVLE